MHIGVIGISSQTAPLALFEEFTKAAHRLFSPELTFTLFPNLILISTCNRCEIYYHASDPSIRHIELLAYMRPHMPPNIDSQLYSLFGEDCFIHLAKVTSGLKSRFKAESEIQRQVKQAYSQIAEKRKIAHDLHYLFQKCLKIGKGQRTKHPLPKGLPTLEGEVEQIIRGRFNSLDDKSLLYIGNSETNHKIMQRLKPHKFRKVTILTRHPSKRLPYEQISHLETHTHYDIVIAATKSLKVDVLRPEALIFDLSHPRVIDPRITSHNIDELGKVLEVKRGHILNRLFESEREVECAARRLCYLFKRRRYEKISATTLTPATPCS